MKTARRLTCILLVLLLVVSVYAAEEPTFLTEYARAGEMLRRGMTDRQDCMTVYFASVDPDPERVWQRIWAEALTHTGQPTEGDYLERQYGGYDLDIDWYTLGDVRYYTLTYKVDFYTTAAQEDMVNAAVDTLLHETLAIHDGMSDFEKIKAVYDWICANVTYDRAHRGDDSYPLARTAYAALIDRTAVCQGYSLLMYRLMLELGIDCRVIRGQEREGASPYWNIVRLGDVYYNLDPTEDAGSAPDKYRWFLLTDESLNLLEDRPRREAYASESFYAVYPMSDADYTWQRAMPGNLDGDGQVTADDAIYLLYHTLFGDVYPVSQVCDYDGSGAVDADDAIYLLYYTLFGDALYPLNA